MNRIQNFNVMGQKNMYKDVKFEVNPLDVNLAKIEMNLINRCEKEVPENGDFATVCENFNSKDPTIDLSEINVVCKYDKENPGIKRENRKIVVKITFKNGDTKLLELFSGNKNELLSYLYTKDFFKVCKFNCLNN